MCGSMVDIQSLTAEIRREKKDRKRRYKSQGKSIGRSQQDQQEEEEEEQPFYCPLSGTTRVSRYQKKHSPTHHP